MTTLITCLMIFGAWLGGYGFGKRRGRTNAKIAAEGYWPFASESEARKASMENHPAGKGLSDRAIAEMIDGDR